MEGSVIGPFERGGILRYCFNSEYQRGATDVRILLPQRVPVEQARILYVLPDQPGLSQRRGSGLNVIRDADLHNRFGCICVFPSFSDWPWMGDHPTDPELRNESYLMRDVFPFIRQLYPHASRATQVLGMSKGGNAALSLILRFPDLIHSVAIWDSPLMKVNPDEWEMPLIYGTVENFRRCAVPLLLQQHADLLRGRQRVVMHGFGMFREHLVAAHELMTGLEIPHTYSNFIQREHHWESGWMEPLIEAASALV
jgi:hypothetical protein